MKQFDDIAELARRVCAGERAALGRAITLAESKNFRDEDRTQTLLQAVRAQTGKAYRIGITGPPGAGKSTLINTLGGNLIAAGHKIAVLAVDPTSQRAGGSILGDKTRMSTLATETNAFIRPSPAGATLGGVARRSREAMLLCEAAGYDVVIIETVGTGQSEVAVAGMVDCFAVLMLPGSGDDLQGIKRGVLELADVIAVNKADGDNAARARRSAADCQAALNIITPSDPHWRPVVLTLSGLANQGLDRFWQVIQDHRATLEQAHALEPKRAEQRVRWMRSMLEERLMMTVRAGAENRTRLAELENQVRAGVLTPFLAVQEITRHLDLP